PGRDGEPGRQRSGARAVPRASDAAGQPTEAELRNPRDRRRSTATHGGSALAESNSPAAGGSGRNARAKHGIRGRAGGGGARVIGECRRVGGAARGRAASGPSTESVFG